MQIPLMIMSLNDEQDLSGFFKKSTHFSGITHTIIFITLFLTQPLMNKNYRRFVRSIQIFLQSIYLILPNVAVLPIKITILVRDACRSVIGIQYNTMKTVFIKCIKIFCLFKTCFLHSPQ